MYLFLNNARRVWSYIRGNQDLYIEEEQTTQWPSKKRYKQRSTKYETNDWLTRTPLNPGSELMCSGRTSSSSSTSDTRRVNLVISIIKFKVLLELPNAIGDRIRWWLFCLKHLISCSQRLIYYIAFQSFDLESTWWWIFKKRVLCTILDIYSYLLPLPVTYIVWSFFVFVACSDSFCVKVCVLIDNSRFWSTVVLNQRQKKKKLLLLRSTRSIKQ